MTLRCFDRTQKKVDPILRHIQDVIPEKRQQKSSPHYTVRTNLLILTLLVLAMSLASCDDLGKKIANASEWKAEREAGRAALNAAQFETAQAHFDKARELLPKGNTDDQKQLGSLLCEMGRAAQGLTQSERALNLFRDGLTRVEADLGAQHPDALFCTSSIAKLYFEQENYAAAASLQQRLLVVHEKQFGVDHLQTAENLHNLALSLLARGNNRQAEALLQRAVTTRKAQLPATDEARLASERALATVYFRLGKFDLAETILLRILETQKTALGRENLAIAQTLQQLGEVNLRQGRLDDAAKCHEQALAIRSQLLGATHPETGESMNHLGRAYYGQKKLPHAEALFRRALEIFEQAPPATTAAPSKAINAKIATVLQDMARLQLELKNYAEAEPLYQRAFELREKIHGPTHLEVAKSLLQLAHFYTARGLDAKAKPFLQRALQILETVLDPSAEELIQTRSEYVHLLRKLGQEEQAQKIEASGRKSL